MTQRRSEPESVTADAATVEDWTPHFGRQTLDECVTKYSKLVAKSCWVRQREKEDEAEEAEVEALCQVP